jgi:hypothetical protein
MLPTANETGGNRLRTLISLNPEQEQHVHNANGMTISVSSKAEEKRVGEKVRT